MAEIPKPAATAGDTEWFVANRFGMFIHWGTYALAARHEWVKNREEIPDDVYMKYFNHFDPDLYDPAEWARAAREAGMRYFVITTKHHEGFCLWDSQYTDYKATNTPYGKDVLRPMVEAFRAVPPAAPLWAAVEAAADADPEVAARRDELLAGAIATLVTLVRLCAERGWLGGSLTEEERVAALYTVGTMGTVQLVMRDLGMQQETYESWMRRTVEWALLGSV